MSQNSNNPGKVGIWGPPVNSPTPNGQAPYNGTIPSLQPNPYGVAPPGPRIRWGLLDVLWGFLFMIITQVLLSIGLMVVVAVDMVANNTAIEDPEALLDSVLAEAYSGPFLLVSSLAMYLSWWLPTHWATMKKGVKSYAKDFWLKFNWKRDIAFGLAFAAVVRTIEQGVLQLIAHYGNVDLNEASNSEVVLSQPGIWLFINAFLVAGLLAPFFEELFFRGLFLQGAMRTLGRSRRWNSSKMGKSTWLYRNRVWISVAVTSVLFGLMHFQGDVTSVGHWIVVAQTGIIGLLLAIVTIKTKRLGPAITGHIAFNLSGVILGIILGG